MTIQINEIIEKVNLFMVVMGGYEREYNLNGVQGAGSSNLLIPTSNSKGFRLVLEALFLWFFNFDIDFDTNSMAVGEKKRFMVALL